MGYTIPVDTNKCVTVYVKIANFLPYRIPAMTVKGTAISKKLIHNGSNIYLVILCD